MKRVLRVGSAACGGGHTGGFVVGEQALAAAPRHGRLGMQPAGAEPVMRRDGGIDIGGGVISCKAIGRRIDPDDRLRTTLLPPSPGIAEPERRQDVEGGRLRAPVGGRDADGDILLVGLGIFDEDVEIPVVGKNPGVDQFVFHSLPTPRLVLGDELCVGKLPLRIAVEQAHVGMRRRVVDVKVVVLHILAMVALEGIDAEQPLLEVIVGSIPEGGREAEDLVAIADAGDAVLAPAVGLGPRHVVGEIRPGITVGGVVLADGSPGAVGEIGAKASPSGGVVAHGGNALALRAGGLGAVS